MTLKINEALRMAVRTRCATSRITAAVARCMIVFRHQLRNLQTVEIYVWWGGRRERRRNGFLALPLEAMPGAALAWAPHPWHGDLARLW